MNYHGTFIFPETGERKTGRLIVDKGRITAFQEGTAEAADEVLEGFVTPGLIDAHVHLLMDGGADPTGTLRAASLVERVLQAQSHMRQQLAAGVTTVRDLGGPDGIAVALSGAVAAGKQVGPHIRPLAKVGQ